MPTPKTDSIDPSSLEERVRAAGSAIAEPGLVMVFAASQPYCTLVPVGPTPLELGRGQGLFTEHPDSLMSRRHARVSFCDQSFVVTDLDSRNGSAVDGVPLHGTTRVAPGGLIRLGGTLFYCCADLGPFRKLGINRIGHRVLGPALQLALRTVTHIALSSRVLFISGESGAGKESLAQEFHRAGPQRDGPFIAVNCAAIPEGIAERLIFGARKGAFSGIVSDSQGYIEAADGGTLFLDEVADLDTSVQAKLLRVIESGELLPLGATHPRKVQFRVCTATHQDLRALTQEKKFRTDLYFRIGMPQVVVPPLRRRKEEIPWLVAGAIRAIRPELSPHVSLIEMCMLRTWPGNVRELLAEISTAAIKAGEAGNYAVSAEQLSPSAGAAMPTPVPAPVDPTPASGVSAHPAPMSAISTPSNQSPATSPSAPPSRATLLAALLEAKGNLSAAARALRVHRTQLRRLLVRHKIDLAKLRDMGQL